MALAEDLEEEEEGASMEEIEGDEDERPVDNNVDGLVDKAEHLDEEEHGELRKAVLPVRMMLTKVCYITCDLTTTHTDAVVQNCPCHKKFNYNPAPCLA